MTCVLTITNAYAIDSLVLYRLVEDDDGTETADTSDPWDLCYDSGEHKFGASATFYRDDGATDPPEGTTVDWKVTLDGDEICTLEGSADEVITFNVPTDTAGALTLEVTCTNSVDAGDEQSDDGTVNIIKVDSIKFQKLTMGSSWKTVDEVYKHLGVYTGQSATFGVNHTPSSVTIPNGFLTWGGLASGDTPEVSVTFSTANFLEAVTVTCGSTTKSALVAVRDQPSGMGETAYAALHAVYTAIALANDLIGTDVSTLEPFIWANAAYPGVQHNTVADACTSCLLVVPAYSVYGCRLRRGVNYGS